MEASPPRELIDRTGRFSDQSDERVRELYAGYGRAPKAAITGALPAGYSFEGRRVLDFGCGSGRVLREFLPEAESGEFWGCDLHAPTIDWLNENLSPPLHFYVNDQVPMPHPDGYFDLIYAISVFTHITHDWSAWLLELHRILKPDGYLLATIIGPSEWGRSLADPPDENGLGMCVQRLGQGLTKTSGPRLLHSPWWLRSHWGRAFEIVSLSPVGFAGTYHGFVLGRKKDVALTRNDLELHEPGDAREVEAQRRQLEILEREAVERERARGAANAELRHPRQLARSVPAAIWRRARRRFASQR
jgi:SAM-dependent methyltransferase